MLKKVLALALVLAGAFLFAPAARSQSFTTVTATVHDPNGIPYAGGTVTATLTPSVPGGYTLNGRPYSGQISGGSLDSGGSFTMNFGSNAVILPAGSQWQIRVASNPGGIAPPLGTGAQSFTVTMTISGASQNISTTVNAAAPALTHFAGTGGTVTSVSCGNLASVFNCSVANPTSTPALSFVPVTTGPVLDCSQQPGSPDAGLQINNCLAALSGGTGIADATKFGPTATITTPIVNSISATIATCGTFWTQIGKVTLSGNGSSWWACPNGISTLDKAANIDQISITGTNNSVLNTTFSGEAASFTGNGIVIDNSGFGEDHAKIQGNTIANEANDLIFSNNGTRTDISNNVFQEAILHAYEANGTLLDHIHDNIFLPFGDDTGKTIYAHGNCQLTIENNPWIQNRGGFPAIDVAACLSQVTRIIGNPSISVNAGTTAILGSGNTFIGNNVGGSPALSITGGGGVISNNTFSGSTSTNQDAVRLIGANQETFSDNVIALSNTGTGGACGFNITGDTIGVIAHHNQVTITSGAGTADFGGCMTLTSGHMLANVVDGLDVIGVGAAPGTAAFKFDNTVGLNINVNNRIVRVAGTHITNIYKRIDAQNNQEVYEDAILSDLSASAMDAGTGSTNDIFIQRSPAFSFASLPSPVGNNSMIACLDCTQGIGAAGGGGGYVIRAQGAWITMPSTTSPTVSSGFGTGAAVTAGGIPSSFRLSIGTTNTGTGVIGLPVSKTGWNCTVTNVTSKNANQAAVYQTADSTTSATLQNYTDVMATHAMTDNDVLSVSCFPH